MRANATSKSPIIPRPSTAAAASRSTHTSIRRLVCKSAMNWGTVVQTWSRLISMVEHEQGIRHGAIPCRHPERVAFHAPASPPPSEGYSSSDCQTLAHRQPMGLAAKTSCMVSKCEYKNSIKLNQILLLPDHKFNISSLRESAKYN